MNPIFYLLEKGNEEVMHEVLTIIADGVEASFTGLSPWNYNTENYPEKTH